MKTHKVEIQKDEFGFQYLVIERTEKGTKGIPFELKGGIAVEWTNGNPHFPRKMKKAFKKIFVTCDSVISPKWIKLSNGRWMPNRNCTVVIPPTKKTKSERRLLRQLYSYEELQGARHLSREDSMTFLNYLWGIFGK